MTMKAIILSLAASHVSAEIVEFRRLPVTCTCTNGTPADDCVNANVVKCKPNTCKPGFEGTKCIKEVEKEKPSEYIQLCVAGKFPNQAIAHDMPDMIPVCHNDPAGKTAQCELKTHLGRAKKDDNGEIDKADLKKLMDDAVKECRGKCSELQKKTDDSSKVNSDYMLDRACNAFRVSESGTSCELFKIPGSSVPACGTGKGPALYGAVNVDYYEMCTQDKLPSLGTKKSNPVIPTPKAQAEAEEAKLQEIFDTKDKAYRAENNAGKK